MSKLFPTSKVPFPEIQQRFLRASACCIAPPVRMPRRAPSEVALNAETSYGALNATAMEAQFTTAPPEAGHTKSSGLVSVL
jgi:hypothetical protein